MPSSGENAESKSLMEPIFTNSILNRSFIMCIHVFRRFPPCFIAGCSCSLSIYRKATPHFGSSNQRRWRSDSTDFGNVTNDFSQENKPNDFSLDEGSKLEEAGLRPDSVRSPKDAGAARPHDPTSLTAPIANVAPITKKPRGRPRKKVNIARSHGLDMRYHIEIDAEWWQDDVSNQGYPPLCLPPRFITLQIRNTTFGPKGRKFLFEHPQWALFNKPNPVKIKRENRRAKPAPESWKGETPLPDILGPRFSQRPPRTDERLTSLPKLRLTIAMFYSFADVVALLGTRLSLVLVEYLATGKCIRVLNNWAPLPHVIIERKKAPSGNTGSVGRNPGAAHQSALHPTTGPDNTCIGYTFIERQLVVNLRDLYSLEYESLQSTATAYNVPMPAKDSMDYYKSMMHVAYRDPELRPKMIEYALGDLILADLWEAYQHNYMSLCKVSGVEPQLPPPATKGALVAHLFEKVLNSTIPLEPDFYQIFDIPDPRHNCQMSPSIAHLLTHYSCKALAQSEKPLTKRFLSIVHGGRAHNENPLQIRREGLFADMDIVSAYGQALQYLNLPIGHPALLYYTHHHPSEWPTLREILKLYRSELVEGSWYMVIDTCGEQLTFPQNILFSKYFKNDMPEIIDDPKHSDNFREDPAHIKGDFMLLEREVRNGILTHYSLSFIEHCASNQELAELLDKLRVKTAMIYPKSLCIEYTGPESVDKWIAMARNHTGQLNTVVNLKQHSVTDNRVGPWLKYPLGTFISPLLEKRQSLKAEMKQHPTGGTEWRRLNAAQLSVKKVVNTLYGTLASIYFQISSPCVANNVTDRCRMANFMMSAAAATQGSITDGGASELNSVSFWRENAPSLATMAYLHLPHLLPKQTRSRHFTAPLGTPWNTDQPVQKHARWDVDSNGLITGPGLDKPVIADTAIAHIEQLYDPHIRQYFTYNGQPLPAWCDTLKFECKLLGQHMAVHGCANYAIGRLPGSNLPPIIKARGHRLAATHYHPNSGAPIESPMKTMMLRRLSGEPMQVRESAICYKPASVSDYRTRREFRNQGGLPGYSIAQQANVRLITCSEFNFPTVAIRRDWMRYYTYLNRRYGLGLEASYIDSTITSMTVQQIESAKADIQNRIYKGESPNSIRVHRSIRPLIEYSPKVVSGYDDCEAADDTASFVGGIDDDGEAVKGGLFFHGSSDDDTGDLDD